MLDQVLSPSNLDMAWRRLSSDKSQWDSITSRKEMERHLLHHLYTLTDQVRERHYQPGSMRQFSIAKPNGSRRVLSALYLRDKLLQRAVLQVIEPMAEKEFDDDSYGYRPKRNVQMAITRALERVDCGMPWLVDADLEQFFDSIPHRPLVKILRRKIRNRGIEELMSAWLRQSVVSGNRFTERRGIAQGAVLSPIQCNYYLNELDLYWRKKGIPFVRFADDFLLFAPTKDSAKKALALTDKKLSELRIKLNFDKTSIVKASRQVEFLGQRLRAPRKYK